jgi:N-acetylmuramoyl-L-alanine amidase
MLKLNYNDVRYLIVHTAAAPFNCDAADIDLWHKKRGFNQIGYHWVIRGSGYDNMLNNPKFIEEGRSIEFRGAHALGSNHNSFGVCLTGHGDYHAFTPGQINYLFTLLIVLRRRFPDLQMIGHNEIQHYNILNYTNFKTCPGTKNNMNFIRMMYTFLVENQKRMSYIISGLYIYDSLFVNLDKNLSTL